MQCKFCRVEEGNEVDFYLCDECQSCMCHNCMFTSTRTGRDFCLYCLINLRIEGKRIQKGDIVIGPTPKELMGVGMVCHKSEGRGKFGPIYACGVQFEKGKIGPLSHENWDKVTCHECLALKEVN